MTRLSELTWLEVKRELDRGVDAFILPIGTIEPHSTHLPLGTDAFIPEDIADRVAARINAFVLPTVYYGVTKSLHGYPGSIRVRPEIIEELLYDILSSMKFHGFKVGLVLNGHGGSEQTQAVDKAAYRAWIELKMPVMVVEWWILAREKGITLEYLGKEGGHAGTDETACILATRPSLVKKDLYKKGEVVVYMRGVKTYPYQGSIINYSENEGDVAFDVEKARVFFEKLIEEIVEEFKNFRSKLKRLL